MKKISLHSLIIVACFALVTSCAKDVKKPATTTNASSLNKSGTTTNTNTSTQTGSGSTQSSGGCSGGYSGNSGHSYGG